MKKMIRTLAGLSLLLLSPWAFPQEISPLLVGTNVWYSQLDDQVWELTGQCGVKIIRIGGHAYDRNLPSRETLLDWVTRIQDLGAEALIQVSKYGSVEEAADVVRYFNVELKGRVKPVRYWNIGNEPWLQAGRPDLDTVGAMVEAYFKPMAAAMKEVDPSIRIYGPNFCDYLDQPMEDLFGGKNDITGRIPGKPYYYCDGLTWHRYPQGDGDPAVEGANDFLERILKARSKVDHVNALHGRTGEDALIWGIGEYNSKGGEQVHTWGNGQMFGAVLGWCMEYGAEFATSWSMFEHGGSRTGTDFSLIDGANMVPRASYRHMELVAEYFTGTFLKGASPEEDFMVFGASDGSRTSVMIMNRGFGEPRAYTLRLDGEADRGDGLQLGVSASLDRAYRDEIGPRTTQVLVFEGDAVRRINYSSEDFDNERPPSMTMRKQD